MRTLAITALALVALAGSFVHAQDNAFEKMLDDPPATGLMVSLIADGSQAKEAGMALGDVIVSYGGQPVSTLETLNEAKAAAAEQESIEVTAVRGERVIVFVFVPGPIGINVLPVQKGVPAAELPAATKIDWDFSRLSMTPRDDWYDFVFPGKGKVGFEHARLELEDGHLILRREVAFDGGEAWGLNHFNVQIKLALEPVLHVVSTRFENPITKWVGEGTLSEDGKQWHFAWGGEGHESGNRAMPMTTETLPDYILESLVSFMPREIGACFHYRSMSTGWPGPEQKSALHAAAEEEIEVAGEKMKTLRFELHTRGGPGGLKHWVDGSGRVVMSNYGGAMGIISTREKALSNLNEKIVPRTAGSPRQSPGDPVAAALAAPPATGMLVMRVVNGSAAYGADIRRGDIIVAYNGESTPDFPSVAAAKEQAAEQESVVLRVNRAGTFIDFTLPPGTIGVYLLPVTRGVAVPPLPKATVTRLDLSPLVGKTRDEWLAAYWGSEEKNGWLNIRTRAAGDRLFVRTEFAYEDPEGGRNHARLVTVLKTRGDPSPLLSTQDHFISKEVTERITGRALEGGKGTIRWSIDGLNVSGIRHLPFRSIPTSALPAVASLLPREEGACLRFHPLYESVGEAGLPCALLCTGAEEIELQGRSVVVFRYEWRQIGDQILAVYRIGADGRVVAIDQGDGAFAMWTTREEALAGLPKELMPR